jgi:hypothetical protein
MTKDAVRRRRAIVVLGMHRAGSSAMTRVLSFYGAQLPSNLMPSYTYNVSGHWEPQEVADFNDTILAELDSRWDDPFGPKDLLSHKRPTPKQVDRAREILRSNYDGVDDIALKEPRIAVLSNIWTAALNAEGFHVYYIIMVRAPHEVAASLKTRDNMPEDQAMLLWATYMIASESVSRGHPRIFINFNDLLESPDRVMDRIEQALDLTLNRRTWEASLEVKAFLDPDQRHERIERAIFEPGLEPLQNLYDCFSRAAQDEPIDEKIIEKARHWLSSIEAVAAPMIKRLEMESRARLKTIEQLHHHAINIQQTLDERVLQAEAQHAQIGVLDRQIAELQERLNAEKSPD